jgi:putative hydrolase of the HAD superfamily
MPRSPSIDAVTVDGFGTIVQLRDPVANLDIALRDSGIVAEPQDIGRAFQAEAAYYRPRSLQGRDQASLSSLRNACVGVFLDELNVELEVEGFVDGFMAALRFELLPGARASLESLRSKGVRLACVANWDIGLHDELDRLGISDLFQLILTSADAGAAKPDPAIFLQALAALGATPSRSVHIGDEDVDRIGSIAAGMRFEPIPLETLPERLFGTMAG